MAACEAGLQQDLTHMYTFLQARSLDHAASDFYLMRKAKQRDQYEQDPLKYEHTAISHFLQWHSPEGARVPAFQRKGERSLSAVFQARAGLA
jgi:hypothetical protein